MPSAATGDETRARLLAATNEVVIAQGWAGVSTRLVAQQAGVKPGVVHYHFASVEDLKRRAAEAALRGMTDPFAEEAEALSPRQMLAAIAEASVTDLAPDTDPGRLIYEILLAAGRDEPLQAILRPMLEEFQVRLARSIRRWHPAPTHDVEVLAELVLAAIDGLQLHLLVQRDLDLPRHLAPLLDLLGPEVPPAA